MIIAFSFLNHSELNKNENFIFETFNQLSKSHSQHTFIFISSSAYQNSIVFFENVISVKIDFEAKRRRKWMILYNIKIGKVLKKYKPDVFISENICSLYSKVPQILIFPNTDFVHQPDSVKKKYDFFYKKFTRRFFNKAKSIVVFSEFTKAGICKEYKIDPGKIEVIYIGLTKNTEPINEEEREEVKEKYAEGNEFFLYRGIISMEKNLINLLKAFSAFKKRQRSSMQLIFAGTPGKYFDEFTKSLSLYKFKKEIKVLAEEPTEKLAEISSAAYAMITPSAAETNGNFILNSMNANVAVLLPSAGGLKELAADAAIYFDAANFSDMADKMMLIFKDEDARNEVIKKGNERVKKFNWGNSSSALWSVIEKVISDPTNFKL